MKVSEFIEDYNVREALDISTVDPEDIAEVIHYDEGCNDEASWKMVLRMTDGQWCYVEAWCDYTGWDCQAGGSAYYASTEEELATTKMTQIARRIFGYEPTVAYDL